MFDLTPHNCESQNYIGVAELSRRELEKNPKYSHAYWWLGRAHYNLGNDVESMKYFKELMEVEPTWEEEHIMPYLEKLRARAKSR